LKNLIEKKNLMCVCVFFVFETWDNNTEKKKKELLINPWPTGITSNSTLILLLSTHPYVTIDAPCGGKGISNYVVELSVSCVETNS